jgi:hypothetical protein
VLVGEGLPDDAIADCYLATVTAAGLVDMARAAVLLAHGLRMSRVDPNTLPPAGERTLMALVDARRMRPNTLRKTLAAMRAAPDIYSDFVRLCPGAITGRA